MVSSGPAPTVPCVFCAEGSRAGHITPGGVSPERQNHLPLPAGHSAWDAAQDVVGLLGCERTLVCHAELLVNQHSQVLLSRATLSPLIPQPVLIVGAAPIQVHNLALGLVKPHQTRTGPLLQPVQVPLNGILSFWCINCTHSAWCDPQTCWGCTWSCYVIDENIKQHWSQYSLLRDTTCHQSPFGHRAIDYYPLDVTIQPIPYPMNKSKIKFLSPQFREKDVVRNHVEGFTEVHITSVAFPLTSLFHVREKTITFYYLVLVSLPSSNSNVNWRKSPTA